MASPHKTYNIMETKINTIYMVCKDSSRKIFIEVIPGSGYETYGCLPLSFTDTLEASKRYTYRPNYMSIKEFPDYQSARADLDKTLVKAGKKRRSLRTTSKRKKGGCFRTHKIRIPRKYAGKKTSKRKRKSKRRF